MRLYHLLFLLFVFTSTGTAFGKSSARKKVVDPDASRDTATMTAWTSFAMTITATTTNPTKATTTVVDQAYWRRVGDCMEISYVYGHINNAGASVGGGDISFFLTA